jgi:hypothetical protein
MIVQKEGCLVDVPKWHPKMGCQLAKHLKIQVSLVKIQINGMFSLQVT